MADRGADCVDGSRDSVAKQVFELGKDLFNRVQIGRVFWQEEKLGADRADELANCLAPVAAEVVQDDDIAGSKDGQQNLLDIGTKAHTIDWPFDEPWRIDPVMAQSRQEGHSLPAAVRNLGVKSVSARRPSPQRRHIGPGPGLVDEDQPLSFDAILILCPLDSSPRDLGSVAFASRHAFFEAELLGMHEVPHRVAIDLQATTGELGNETTYGEIVVPDPLRQPDCVVSRNRLWLVTAHLARLNAAGLIAASSRWQC